MQAEHRNDFLGTVQLELAQAAPLFDPAKHLLDAAAGMDRLGVALVPRGAAIDGGTTRAGGVLGHVRCHADPPEFSHQSLGVVVLVGADRLLMGTGERDAAMALAASLSPVPTAWVTQQSTIRAWRLSMSTWPR